MNSTGIKAFDTTVQTTNLWLKDVMDELGWDDRYRAYHALRTVLHALRDRLTVSEAVDLAAQLPMLVRGFYYEGWRPSETPLRERKKQDFLAHIAAAYRDEPLTDFEAIARAVFKVLARHVTKGEIKDIKGILPAELRAMWP
jgi:uncharacterized protein (DUF2267 family)